MPLGLSYECDPTAAADHTQTLLRLRSIVHFLGGAFPLPNVEVNHADHVDSGGARFGLPCGGGHLRFPISCASDGEPGFCDQRWRQEQQRQKNRLVFRPEAGHPNLRMHLDWGCLGCWKNYRTKRPPASQPLL